MEWLEERIKQMIDTKIPESLSLDYKGSASLQPLDSKKRTELSKDVSSFANSAGGTIIYGVKESREAIPVPEDFDEGIDPATLGREQLEQILLSIIHPKIEGLKISMVPLGKTRNGCVNYVIEIPESNTAHQAEDKKYHKRWEFTTAAMEDYEVRDVMNRGKTAQLDIRFDIKRELTNGIPLTLYVYLKNTGQKVIHNATLEICPLLESLFAHVGSKFRPCKKGNGQKSVSLDVTFVIYPSQEIIFIGNGGTDLLGFKDDSSFYVQEISWTLYADDMTPKNGVLKIADFIKYSPIIVNHC